LGQGLGAGIWRGRRELAHGPANAIAVSASCLKADDSLDELLAFQWTRAIDGEDHESCYLTLAFVFALIATRFCANMIA